MNINVITVSMPGTTAPFTVSSICKYEVAKAVLNNATQQPKIVKYKSAVFFTHNHLLFLCIALFQVFTMTTTIANMTIVVPTMISM
jgi:hypothetical protein